MNESGPMTPALFIGVIDYERCKERNSGSGQEYQGEVPSGALNPGEREDRRDRHGDQIGGPRGEDHAFAHDGC